MAKAEVIELNRVEPKVARITIVGDGDLICNQMNQVVSRQLTDTRKGKAKNVNEEVNVWEEIITSVHWRDGNPTEYSEESLKDCLENNAPCITAFGLYKSFGDAVVRFGIDTYATKFKAGVNIVAKGGLVPFTFTEYNVDEKLMSPKKGAPVLVHLNRFSGWSAEIEVRYIDTVYSLEQIVNIINLAGFGLGIGSGRSSGYGRYHVESIR